MTSCVTLNEHKIQTGLVEALKEKLRHRKGIWPAAGQMPFLCLNQQHQSIEG